MPWTTDWSAWQAAGGNVTGNFNQPTWTWTPDAGTQTSIAPAAVAPSTGVNPVETQYSLYGNIIPLTVFGVGRIGGDIISGPWINNGLASFIISFGVPANPSGTRELREIAFDSEVVWQGSLVGAGTPSASGFSTEPFTVRFYDGTLTQGADALETTNFGADAVAYRPQILLVFENLPLANTKFGKIPYVAAVIADTHGDDVNLGEAFERLAASPWVDFAAGFEAVGITDGLVSGGLIIAEQIEFLALIQQFGRFYPKWSILQTDKLRIVDRGADVTPDIILDETMLIDKLAIMRQEQSSVASVLELSTIDPDADYTILPSQALIPRKPVAVTSSRKTDAAYLPAIMNADTRIAIVTYTQQHEDRARKQVSGTAMIVALQIEPGDLLGLEQLGPDFPGGETFRVLETTHGVNNVVEFVAESILQCSVSSLTTAPPTYANFDPSTAVHTIVSNHNLTATGTTPGSGGVFVYLSEAKSSGKVYFEVKWVALSGFLFGGAIGVAATTASINDVYNASNSTVLYQGPNFTEGQIYASGSASGYHLGHIDEGDVIGVAADMDNGQIWFVNVTQGGDWNGSSAAGDPATNVHGVPLLSGLVRPAVVFGVNSDVYTANFGATPFAGTVPSGYTHGWY